MAGIKLIFVGALKNSLFKQAAEHYLSTLERRFKVNLCLIKDASGDLPIPERVKREGKAIFKALGEKDRPVCLDERGKALTSLNFSRELFSWIEDPSREPCFIIGGAFGLSDAVRGLADPLLSLGPCTLPHELARVVLLEQLYRADCIRRGLPYHHV